MYVMEKKNVAVTAFLVLTVVIGAASVAGAQTEDGGMEDNDTDMENMTENNMTDGDDDSNMTDDMEEEMGEDDMEDGGMDGDGMDDEETEGEDTMDDGESGGDGAGESLPGFGVVAAALALLVGAGYAVKKE